VLSGMAGVDRNLLAVMPLREAAEHFDWDAAKHPRDEFGRFIEVLAQLEPKYMNPTTSSTPSSFRTARA
jgi:hypothetical protein